MSCLAKSQFKHSSKHEGEKFYFADDGDDEFDFQYVPADQFKYIVKDVRRQRNRDDEERVWETFLKEQELATSGYNQTYVPSKCKASRTLAESIEDVDRELLRLEADTLPETYNLFNGQERNQSARIARNSPKTKENGTGSTNFLLTIPEEENLYYASRSSKTHKIKNRISKSRSDQAFRKSESQINSCRYSTHDLNYNSSPDISPDRFINEYDSVPVRPDPIAVSKILGIQKKISIVLNSILFELDRIPLPDGDDDLIRRQQRVVEFSTRLSRNYLYDLGRQITDIQRHVKAIDPDRKMRLTRRGIILHMQAVEQKLITAHQLLLTALSAYWKHIPSSVLKSHPGKLKEILQVVIQLKNICAEIKIVPECCCSGDNTDAFLGQETENQCAMILSKFRLLSDNESQALSHRTRSTTMTPCRSRKQKNRKALTNRLSMYAMDMKLIKAYQPRKSHSMLQLPRGRKHNSITKPHQDSKKSHSASLKKTMSEQQTNENRANKIRLPLKEDDIKTVIETYPSNIEAQSPRSIATNRKSDLKKSISIDLTTKESIRLSKSRTNNDKAVSVNDIPGEKNFSTLLPVIDLLNMVKQGKSSDQKSLPPESIDTLYNILQKCQQEENSGATKVPQGTNNMQLICYSEEDNEEIEEVISDTESKEELNDAPCQANYLIDSKACKLSVCESAALCLTDYRDQYHNSVKSNPMYTSNTQNKPWDVVAWIADKLVDELISELSDDFQMGDVIQKLFDLEFQEF